MKKRTLRERTARCGLLVALVALPFLSGCVVAASQEQLKMLEEARRAADAAEADLTSCKQKQAELLRTLASKKQVLTKKTADLDAVRRGLGQ